MCGKQYAGSTTLGTDGTTIRQRKAERGKYHMQKYLHDHFLSED